MAPAPWTTPVDLRRQVQRLWDRGAILSAEVTGEALFPKRLALKRPGSAELNERFDEARAWSAKLRAAPRVRVEMRAFHHRVFGTNALPHEAWVDSAGDAVAMIGKRSEVVEFRRLVDLTRARQPCLLAWLARRPLRALELAGDWNLLLDVVDWLQDHPRPGIYIRQIDVPGVHSKFVEGHRGVLGELLDAVLPPASIDSDATGAARFARRYGFLEKPAHIRFRILDPALTLLPAAHDGEGIQDLTLDAASFAALETGVSRVFMTENEINFLAFPPMKDSMAIFGAGYGFDRLGRTHWLARRRLYYWGDIDTHGFAILDALRGRFAHVQSLLMDRDTFLEFKSLWGTEDSPTDRELGALTAEELALYDDLRDNRLGRNLRLEQERIGYGWVKDALSRL